METGVIVKRRTTHIERGDEGYFRIYNGDIPNLESIVSNLVIQHCFKGIDFDVYEMFIQAYNGDKLPFHKENSDETLKSLKEGFDVKYRVLDGKAIILTN